MKKTLIKTVEDVVYTLECAIIDYNNRTQYELTLLKDEKRPLEVLNFKRPYGERKALEYELIKEVFTTEEIENLKADLWQSMKPC